MCHPYRLSCLLRYHNPPPLPHHHSCIRSMATLHHNRYMMNHNSPSGTIQPSQLSLSPASSPPLAPPSSHGNVDIPNASSPSSPSQHHHINHHHHHHRI